MYKEINIGSNLCVNTFLLLIDLINSKNHNLNLKVLVHNNKNVIFDVNENVFFKLGQLLMFLYIMNINSKDKPIIRYTGDGFYVEISETDNNENYFNDITCENIINKLINKSIYNKKCFLKELEINDKSLLDIQNGFELTYKTFIDEKINIISFFYECGSENIYLNLIKDINILSPHDLEIQLKLIKLKFQGELPENELVERVIYFRHNYNKFIENSKYLLEVLTRNSIISFYNNKVELMWLGYIDKKLKPIKYMNIYVAIYFAYIAKHTEEKYYLQSAKNAINPLLNEINNMNGNYKDVFGNDYYEILKGLYLLNHYIEYKDLNKSVENNIELFSIIKLTNKLKSNSDIEKLILEFIYDNSLNVINSLIIS